MLASLGAFVALAALVESNRRVPWDRALETALSRNTFDRSDMDMIAVYIGRASLVLAGLVVIVLACRRRVREIAFWLIAVGGALALDPLLKELIQRPAIDATPGDYS